MPSSILLKATYHLQSAVFRDLLSSMPVKHTEETSVGVRFNLKQSSVCILLYATPAEWKLQEHFPSDTPTVCKDRLNRKSWFYMYSYITDSEPGAYHLSAPALHTADPIFEDGALPL